MTVNSFYGERRIFPYDLKVLLDTAVVDVDELFLPQDASYGVMDGRLNGIGWIPENPFIEDFSIPYGAIPEASTPEHLFSISARHIIGGEVIINSGERFLGFVYTVPLSSSPKEFNAHYITNDRDFAGRENTGIRWNIPHEQLSFK